MNCDMSFKKRLSSAAAELNGRSDLVQSVNLNDAENGHDHPNVSSSPPSVPAVELNCVAEDEANLEDPLCTARTARKITFQDVTTASFLIKGGVECTPCTVWMGEMCAFCTGYKKNY